jgi:hypothetical protein
LPCFASSKRFIICVLRNISYETNVGLTSAAGAGKPNIGFLKASLWLDFKKPIFKVRVAKMR